MRHQRAGRVLGRSPSHRRALFRNLCRSLITHESMRTTVPKAKEIRPLIEKLVTLAKKAAVATAEAGKETDPKKQLELRMRALHLRRQAMAWLGPTHGTGIYDKKNEAATDGNDTVLKKLFNVLGPRFLDRPGGYTRVMKLHYRRLGDAGETAVIEFLKEGETKVHYREKKAAPAPAPVTAG